SSYRFSPEMLTLSDHPDSSCALRVRLLLAELYLHYDRQQVPMVGRVLPTTSISTRSAGSRR
ncbi:MAG: hypothetical protein M3Y17_04665, partial [Actinomycetota bacterium]|nr:hypothetical protein [Actinomycetota bacterium]